MSGSRKRGSKWDSKEEHQYNLENTRDTAWSAKAGLSFHDRESEHGYFSPDGVRNGNKWSVMEGSDLMKSKHGLSSRESLPGSRGAPKDLINVDRGKNWKTSTPLDGDETYSMEMSPGLDDWRQQNRRHSPKSDWSRSHRSRSRSRTRSRSRSRSPVRSSKRHSGYYERTRSRSGVSNQICKEFMAGRCRRGSQCHFLHQDIQDQEEGWDDRQKKIGTSKYFTPTDGKEYLMKSGRSADCCTDFLKGNCRRGASCRFAHDDTSDGFNRGSINEVSRERETHKRNRLSSPELDGVREVRRSGDIPCKYFATGNCRNGKYCRFSHHEQARASPERSHGERGGWDQRSVSVNKFRDGIKLRDADASYNVEKSRSGPKWSDVDASNDISKSWTGTKWSEPGGYPNAAKLSKDTNGKIGSSEPRFPDWSTEDRWQHNFDIAGKNNDTKPHYKRVDINEDESISRKIESTAVNTGVSEPRGADVSLGDMEMSPEWSYKIPSTIKKETGHDSHGSKSMAPISTSLPSHDKGINEETAGRLVNGLGVLHPMSTEKSNFQKDHVMTGGSTIAFPCESNASRNPVMSHIDLNFSSNNLPVQSFEQPGPTLSSLPYSSLNAVGQSQVAIPSDTKEASMKVMQNNMLFQEKPNNKLNFGDINTLHGNSGMQSTQNLVSNEQFTQLTNLSASLAQLLGNGQQLPLLHAALNAHDAMQVSSIANSGVSLKQDSAPTVHPSQESTFVRQYDPISDSIEPGKKQDANVNPLGNAQKSSEDGKPEAILSKVLPSSAVASTNYSDYPNEDSSKRELDPDSPLPNQMEPAANREATKDKENGEVEKTKKTQEGNKTGPSEKTDAVDKADEGKKSKDGKGVRAFKFALVEFVKDLLKPTWKDGQINKEAYKNIVKKVVDKVTATMQGANIPQTAEKIDQYLSFSKPKLTKLVQAYVEKFQKS